MILASKWKSFEARNRYLVLLFLMIATSLSGCSDHGDPVGVVDPPGGNDPVSFAGDIQPIFDTNCMDCHGAGGNAGLDLRSGLSYANLVGVAATASSGNRVEAGDANLSVLFQRLSGLMIDPMPPSGVLPLETRDLVEEWINDGALDN